MRFATVISIVLVIWAHYSRPSLADFRSSLATGRLRSIIPPTLAHLSPSFLVDWLDAMLYVPPLAGGNVADADVEFSDGWVATYASVGVSVIRSKERRQHFLGLFGAWLPVPGGLVSLVRGTGVVDILDAQRCSWKGRR